MREKGKRKEREREQGETRRQGKGARRSERSAAKLRPSGVPSFPSFLFLSVSLSLPAALLCVAFVFQTVSPVAFAQRRKAAGSSNNSNKTAARATKQTRRTTSPPATASAATSVSGRSITIQTEPKAAVWINELRRGRTNDAGQLVVSNLRAGRQTLRVRAAGFRERTLPLPPNARGVVQVQLTRTTDEAELLFQQAEDAREGVVSADGTRQDAVALYRRALELRPRFPAARVGLARSLLALDDYEGALEQIEAARRVRPVYAEASAVEGRILRAAADSGAAVESYRRAIREARGIQPEAYAGLGIVLEEKGDYEEAVAAFRKAIAQLDDTEPALYQLLGAAYEKMENWREAVAAYDKYLALAPEGKLAPAIRSIIDQLRRQATEQESSPDN